MKKVFIYLLTASMGLFTVAYAQDSQTTGQKIKKDVKQAGHAIKKGTVKAANTTGEYAVKGAAKAFDKTYEGKTGPNGEKVYITSDNRYYWVDKKGGRHFIQESQLKDKSQ